MYSSDELFQSSRERLFPNKNGDKKLRSSYMDPVRHSLGVRSADDVTIDCWWRHNNQTIVTRSRE